LPYNQITELGHNISKQQVKRVKSKWRKYAAIAIYVNVGTNFINSATTVDGVRVRGTALYQRNKRDDDKCV